MECEEHFEELVRTEQQVVTCPTCGAAKVLKQFSTFAVLGSPRRLTRRNERQQSS